MARRQKHRHWLIASGCALGAIILFFWISHLLLTTGTISALARNGINKIHVICDGVPGEISTQRYYGFEDFSIGSYKEFSDLPISSSLRCQEASVRIERRADLRDRFSVTSSCDGTVLGTAGLDSISCPGVITIDLKRN